MIPKLLTIKGLYSYQAEQTIDFAALTKGNLFGIFGNVGAGKSSILEAIMLALYGEVERMGKQGRNYNIMNLRSDELLIVFDFEIEGKLWRSRVSGRRNSKKYHDVKIESPNFYEFIEDKFEPRDIKTVEKLIGLKPADFKKTIIIPQGTFQDFLQLGDADRTDMMSKLFSLERYDLDPKVKILQQENNFTIEKLNGLLAQIGDIKLEDIENKKTQLIDLQKLIESQQIEIEKKRKEENSLNQLKTDFELWQNTQKLCADLNTKEGYFMTLGKQIEDYEMVVLTFSNLLENYTKTTNEVSLNKANLNGKQKHFATINTQLQELNESKEKMTPQYQQRESLKKQAVEARKIIDIKKDEAEIHELETKLQSGYGFLEAKNGALDKLKKDIVEIEMQKKSLSENQPDWSILNAVKDWFSISLNLQKDIARLETEHKVKAEKLATMHENKGYIVQKDLPLFNIHLAKETKISDVIIQVKSKISKLNAINEKLQHEQLHLKASEKLESIAATLSEGDACPLCGATHHPSVMQISEVRATIKNLDTQIAQTKKDIKSLENIEQQLFTLNSNFHSETEDRQKISIQLADEKLKLDAHLQKFRWDSFSPTNFDAVEKAMQTALDIDTQKKKLEQMTALIQKNKESTEIEIEKYKKRINDLQAEKGAKTAASQVLKTQIEILDFENTKLKPELELTKWAESLEKQYIMIENEYQSLELKIQKYQSEGQLLRGSIETLKQAQIELEKFEKTISLELTEKLLSANFENIDGVKQILASKLDVQKERQKLNEYKNQQLIAKSRLAELNEKMRGKLYDSENHKALIFDIQNIGNQIQIQNRAVGELNSEIIDKEKRLSQRQEIEKQTAECAIRAENLKVLRGLFQGKGFVNFASSVYLQSIIKAANERFMTLTKQQLQLKINENNGFMVYDVMNGGKLRDVRTLSGGQTFQAALSLALALSDHIQSRHQARQNFFFLDEGFGSLDRESLQTVFESLKALRKENRIVGVISHVEDMRLEIDRYLNVRLTENQGSEVELVIG